MQYKTFIMWVKMELDILTDLISLYSLEKKGEMCSKKCTISELTNRLAKV